MTHTYAKYRKKPVVIEAFQWLQNYSYKDGSTHVPWFEEALQKSNAVVIGNVVHINTLEGTMVANHGDWIIRGVMGEIYPCKHEVFIASYEAV